LAELRQKYSDEDLAALIANYPDLLRSLGTGAARGAIDIAILPGDVAELGAQGLDAAVSVSVGQDWSRGHRIRMRGRLGSSPIGKRGDHARCRALLAPTDTRAERLVEQGARMGAQFLCKLENLAGLSPYLGDVCDVTAAPMCRDSLRPAIGGTRDQLHAMPTQLLGRSGSGSIICRTWSGTQRDQIPRIFHEPNGAFPASFTPVNMRFS
jgi:hypothetical protein